MQVTRRVLEGIPRYRYIETIPAAAFSFNSFLDTFTLHLRGAVGQLPKNYLHMDFVIVYGLYLPSTIYVYVYL